MNIENRVNAFNNGSYAKKSYSVKEVSDMLQITRQTVYKLIKGNVFKAVKSDDGYRIIKTSFDNWLDEA